MHRNDATALSALGRIGEFPRLTQLLNNLIWLLDFEGPTSCCSWPSGCSSISMFSTHLRTAHKYSHSHKHYTFLIHKQLINFGHASCREILGGAPAPHPGPMDPHWRANIDVVLGVISEMAVPTKPLRTLRLKLSRSRFQPAKCIINFKALPRES